MLVCKQQVQLDEQVSSLIDSRSSPNSAVMVYCRYNDEVDYHDDLVVLDSMLNIAMVRKT